MSGRSLVIVPRSEVEQGFLDMDREDFKDDREDEALLIKLQAQQLAVLDDKWVM
jgi:hypothetical protein